MAVARILLLACLACLWFQPVFAADPGTVIPATQSSEISVLASKIAALEQQNARQLQAVLDLTDKVDKLLLAPEGDVVKRRMIRVIPGKNGQPSQEVPGVAEYRGSTTVFTADESPDYSGPQVVSFDRRNAADKSPIPLDSVPEWELSQTIGGRHVLEPQTGVPVYALSEWIVRRFGKVKVVDAVRLYGRPVPVGAVFYGDMTPDDDNSASNAQRQTPSYNYNFGGPQN